MDHKSDLVLASARLARSAPESWKQFLGAFELYSQQHADNCIQSSIEELQRNQGRAQSVAHLYKLFSECLVIADKKEGKR